MMPSLQNYQPRQIVKNLPQYQPQYQPQIYQPPQQQFPQQPQYPQQYPIQRQQQQQSYGIMKQSPIPQLMQYNLQPSQQQQYINSNVNANPHNISPVQVSSEGVVRDRIYQQQQVQPQFSQNIPKISPPIYRSNKIVKVVEKISSPQFQSPTYTQEGSFSLPDAPPPPPEKFLPESEYTPKIRVASESKVKNYMSTNFKSHDDISSKVQPSSGFEEKSIIRTTTPQGHVREKQPAVKIIEEEKKVSSHLSLSKGTSTAVNDVFLKCCHRKNVSPKCESRCNFDIINKKILTQMFLGSDPCPQSYGRDLFSCAAQDGDHTDCCRKMNVTRTTAGEKCLAFCKMTPDTNFQADVTYLPCWSVLNDIKQCFKNAIIDSL
uniref:DB domain-containing protein n=1 Tax=Strongyloides papillosus TaxID=174720 RepID=A0A0N5B7G0_STREA